MNPIQVLHFTYSKNEKRTNPVSFSEEGKLVVIDYKCANYNKVKVGEDWKCKLIEEKTNIAIVEPFELIRTKEQNIEMLKSEALKLKEKWQNR